MTGRSSRRRPWRASSDRPPVRTRPAAQPEQSSDGADLRRRRVVVPCLVTSIDATLPHRQTATEFRAPGFSPCGGCPAGCRPRTGCGRVRPSRPPTRRPADSRVAQVPARRRGRRFPVAERQRRLVEGHRGRGGGGHPAGGVGHGLLVEHVLDDPLEGRQRAGRASGIGGNANTPGASGGAARGSGASAPAGSRDGSAGR